MYEREGSGLLVGLLQLALKSPIDVGFHVHVLVGPLSTSLLVRSISRCKWGGLRTAAWPLRLPQIN